MTHPTHSWKAHYCVYCGTLDMAVDGVPYAVCSKAPAPEEKPAIDWTALIRSGVAS